jgi:hypothetical protein
MIRFLGRAARDSDADQAAAGHEASFAKDCRLALAGIGEGEVNRNLA